MRSLLNNFLKRWHRMLNLKRQSPPSWYEDRLHEELLEVETAPTTALKLSEKSDVLFCIIRSKFDGAPVGDLPTLSVTNAHVYAYMLAKFTSRWAFYRTTALLCKSANYRDVREVVNPGKDSKLDEVASRHGIEPVKFRKVAHRLLLVWPLLP